MTRCPPCGRTASGWSSCWASCCTTHWTTPPRTAALNWRPADGTRRCGSRCGITARACRTGTRAASSAGLPGARAAAPARSISGWGFPSPGRSHCFTKGNSGWRTRRAAARYFIWNCRCTGNSVLFRQPQGRAASFTAWQAVSGVSSPSYRRAAASRAAACSTVSGITAVRESSTAVFAVGDRKGVGLAHPVQGGGQAAFGDRQARPGRWRSGTVSESISCRKSSARAWFLPFAGSAATQSGSSTPVPSTPGIGYRVTSPGAEPVRLPSSSRCSRLNAVACTALVPAFGKPAALAVSRSCSGYRRNIRRHRIRRLPRPPSPVLRPRYWPGWSWPRRHGRCGSAVR